MTSKEKPKKITIICKNLKNVLSHRSFLLKYEEKSDVRKESRTMEFIN